MATTALSTLLPLVQLPRCPQNIVLQALRRALRQFCMDTEVWRDELTQFASVADQADYDLTPEEDDVSIHRVILVELDEEELSEAYWSYAPDGTLTIDPKPTTAGTLDVSVVYMPLLDCAEAADWLVSRWGEAIAAKAAGDLKIDPQSATDPVPWHDPTGAALMFSRYNDGVADAKKSLLVGGRSGEVAVTLSPFYL